MIFFDNEGIILKENYFVKCEQITEGDRAMIIMDIKADNLFAFKNFHMNMSYPKKIVNSTIEGEYLKERTNFRYKKVNIIMGSNATGKTTIGKLLMIFANYFNDGETGRFKPFIDNKNEAAYLLIDFVTSQNNLYRFNLRMRPKADDEKPDIEAEVHLYFTAIKQDDSYENCAGRLDRNEGKETTHEEVDIDGWSFSYPQDDNNAVKYKAISNSALYLPILEGLLKTLDPDIKSVIKLTEVENTFAIKMKNQAVIVKDGIIGGNNILSSGTKAGLEIAYIIASLAANLHDLYYCDELFSYVNSDIEKACLSIIIDKLTERKQLFFTTHNLEILDMQLPKHSFVFLKKNVFDEEQPIKCISASQYLKRNTDSLKSAVENDLFCTAPDLSLLFDIMNV